MPKYQRLAFLFPGQGAQYVGMGQDFAQAYEIARLTFEEADEILKHKLSKVIFEGPESTLVETRYSQPAIFTTSVAILRVLLQLFPQTKPSICAGLSLGEYTALYASGHISFVDGLNIVQQRGLYMHEACEKQPGTMAVILGLKPEDVEALVKEVCLPNDLWAANFNCPGQVVISGTRKGIEVGSAAALAKGAKRVLPLSVHGAFHSGLMRQAEERLAMHLTELPLQTSAIELVMNVVGKRVTGLTEIKQHLIEQVTHPVRWEQGIRYMTNENVELFVEIGCGKTLSGFNKRIAPEFPTISIERIADIEQFDALLR